MQKHLEARKEGEQRRLRGKERQWDGKLIEMQSGVPSSSGLSWRDPHWDNTLPKGNMPSKQNVFSKKTSKKRLPAILQVVYMLIGLFYHMVEGHIRFLMIDPRRMWLSSVMESVEKKKKFVERHCSVFFFFRGQLWAGNKVELRPWSFPVFGKHQKTIFWLAEHVVCLANHKLKKKRIAWMLVCLAWRFSTNPQLCANMAHVASIIRDLFTC